MRMVGAMIAYQAELLIRESIESIIDFVDHMVVIDGSPFGASTDGTAEIARSFQKVELISGTYPNKTEQRNAYVKALKRFQGNDTWLLMIDADEVYKEHDLIRIKNAMELAEPFETSICVQHIHFWRNFNTVLRGGMWSGPTANILYRINRFWPRAFYRSHNSLADETGRSMDLGDNRLFTRTEVYHYGHAMGIEAEYLRMLYMARRGDYKGIKTEEDCRRFTRETVTNWFTGQGHGQRVVEEPFYGIHPPSIQKLIESRPELLETPQINLDEKIAELEQKYCLSDKEKS